MGFRSGNVTVKTMFLHGIPTDFSIPESDIKGAGNRNDR